VLVRYNGGQVYGGVFIVTGRPILLTPQREEKEIYPYRRVWRTASREALVLILATAATILATRFLPVRLSETGRRVFGVGFALLPFGLWWFISFRAERRALQPRERLLTVALLGALAASGVALPVTERLFAVEDWLTTAGGLDRLAGYMLTVGVVQEFLKYAVMRYSLWPRVFRTRLDGVAYAMATAVGYATALNLNLVTGSDLDPVSVALRVCETTLAQVAIGTIMGFCLSELTQPTVPIFIVPGGLILASVLAGFSIVLRGGLIVSGVSSSSTGNNAIMGLGMAIFLVVALFSSMGFLIHNADERDLLRRRPE
jgi:RsiW-degrading membrane proteinase PrsW (M82 family)